MGAELSPECNNLRVRDPGISLEFFTFIIFISQHKIVRLK